MNRIRNFFSRRVNRQSVYERRMSYSEPQPSASPMPSEPQPSASPMPPKPQPSASPMPPKPQLTIAIPIIEEDDVIYAEEVYIIGSISDCVYSPSIEIRHGKYPLTDTIVPLVDQLKYTIMSSHFRHSKEIIGLNLLTKVELTLALDYLDNINRTTPKNKTRPKIRELIIDKLNA